MNLAGLPVVLIGLALAQPARGAEGWEARVADMAPALRACLAGRAGAMVVDAWQPPPASGREWVARVALPGGARRDCLVAADGTTILGWTAVPNAARRPGEGLRAFMLERRCVDAWRVADPQGRELGWLAYPACG